MLGEDRLQGQGEASLTRAEAIAAVAASARRLFPLVSEQQARDLASIILADLETNGIRLVRGSEVG